jgi:hypothetical protein
MPYPESCPECGSQFRNTGTHFTARRNEVGRHVLLELGCQNMNRRYWWDFTAGQLAVDENRPAPRLAMASAGAGARSTSAAATIGSNYGPGSNGSTGGVGTLGTSGSSGANGLGGAPGARQATVAIGATGAQFASGSNGSVSNGAAGAPQVSACPQGTARTDQSMWPVRIKRTG